MKRITKKICFIIAFLCFVTVATPFGIFYINYTFASLYLPVIMAISGTVGILLSNDKDGK